MSQDMQMAFDKDDRGSTPQLEAKENANQTPIDIDYRDVNKETGEVIESDHSDEEPEKEQTSAPDAPQEPQKEKPKQTTTRSSAKPAEVYNPGF